MTTNEKNVQCIICNTKIGNIKEVNEPDFVEKNENVGVFYFYEKKHFYAWFAHKDCMVKANELINRGMKK